jgi:hydrogenase nickel incorporation protein HypA/HybF
VHEVGLIQGALALAVKQAEASGATQLHQLRLRVGALSGVVPEALDFAFDRVCQGTMADGARLEIESVPATWWCATCRLEFESESCWCECPRCHAPGWELRRGRELELVSIEIS